MLRKYNFTIYLFINVTNICVHFSGRWLRHIIYGSNKRMLGRKEVYLFIFFILNPLELFVVVYFILLLLFYCLTRISLTHSFRFCVMITAFDYFILTEETRSFT